MSLFGEHALPDLFATGYILWSQFLAADRVEVFDGTECLSVGIGDTVVLCLVLVGKEGKNLSEPDIDSVLRSTDQVLPLVELPSRLQESGTTSYWASFRSDFEDILRQGDDSSSSSQDAIDQPRSTGAPMTFARVHKWDSILCRRHDDTPSTYVEKRRFAISVAVFMAQHPNLWNANERVAIGKAIIRFYLVSTSNDHLSTPSVGDMMKEIFEHVSRDYTENGNGSETELAAADLIHHGAPSPSLMCSLMSQLSRDVQHVLTDQDEQFDGGIAGNLRDFVAAMLPPTHDIIGEDDEPSARADMLDPFENDLVEGRRSPITPEEELEEAVVTHDCIDNDDE